MNLKSQLRELALDASPRLCVQYYYFKERSRGDPPLRIVDRYVKPGDVVLDIGAYRGVYTLRFAQLVGPTGVVHAFEPHEPNFRTLQAVWTGHSNVVLHNVALSDRTGEAELHEPIFNGTRMPAMASLSRPRQASTVTHQTERVRLARLDEFFEPDWRRITFIKCDVEGHELEVLRGAETTLRRWRPTVLIEIEQRHQQADIHTTFDYFADLDYLGFALAPGGLRPLDTFDVWRDQLRFVHEGFQSRMPRGYVSDFIFMPR